jgi:selenocysteine lyase/cysteine desulfurase
MTNAYHYAHKKIKKHVNAGPKDVIITAGSGMTTVINKFQRILGLRVCGKLSIGKCMQDTEKPVVFISHMEHHSNHTSWFETTADVVVIKPGPDMLIDTDELRKELEKHKDRKLKIGSFTACSNVTGIRTPFTSFHVLCTKMAVSVSSTMQHQLLTTKSYASGRSYGET